MDDTKKYPPFDEEAEKKSYIENQEYKEFAAAQRNALKPTGATYKKWARHYLTYLETCKNIQDYAEAAEYFGKNPFDIDLTIDNYNEYQSEAWATSNQISLFDLPNPNNAIDSEKKYLNTFIQDYIGNTVYSFCACSAFMTAYCLWESKESGHIVYNETQDKAIFDILKPFGEILTKKGYANTEKKAAEIIVNMDENAIPALFSALEDVQNTVQSEYLITFTNKALQSLFEFAEKYGAAPKKSRNKEQTDALSALKTIQDGDYVKIPNTASTNYAFRALVKSKNLEENFTIDDNGNAIHTIGDCTVKYKYIDYKMSDFTLKFYRLIFALYNAYKGSGRGFTITTADICELFGKPNTASARKEIAIQVKAAAPVISSISVEYKKASADYTLMQGWGKICNIIIENRTGKINILMDELFAAAMQQSNQIAYYNTDFFKLDGRNSVATAIYDYMATQIKINFGKQNQNIYTIEKLIEISDLPTVEKLKEQKKRHYDQLIIQPLERALEYLQDKNLLQSWEYCNANGEILTDEQLNSNSIDDWAKLRIKAILKNYPNEEAAKTKEREIEHKKQEKKRKKKS